MTDKILKEIPFERRVVLEHIAACGPVTIEEIQHELARQTRLVDTVTESCNQVTALIRSGLVEIYDATEVVSFCTWGQGPYGETEEGAGMEGGRS